eukprot:scaffold36823_cov58-Phaeocystis_antarctica.AAC.6
MASLRHPSGEGSHLGLRGHPCASGWASEAMSGEHLERSLVCEQGRFGHAARPWHEGSGPREAHLGEVAVLREDVGEPEQAEGEDIEVQHEVLCGVGAGCGAQDAGKLFTTARSARSATRYHGQLEACAMEGRCHLGEGARLSRHLCVV